LCGGLKNEPPLKQYELEIPLRLTRRCESLEEAKQWAVRLMCRDIVQSKIHFLDEYGRRTKISIKVYKNGETCPKCKISGEIVTFRKIGHIDQDTSSCRHCSFNF
ncbi:MAG: hypothetical protein ABIL68_07630, partial [bacterium]